MDDYLAKPNRPRELFAVIGRVRGMQAISGSGQVELSQDERHPAVPAGRHFVNWAAALEAVQDDRGLLHKLVGTSLLESSALIAEMHRAISNNDPVSLRRAAHTLNGHFRIFGAAHAELVAVFIETMPGDGSLDVADVFANLQRQVKLIQAELWDFLADRTWLNNAEDASQSQNQ